MYRNLFFTLLFILITYFITPATSYAEKWQFQGGVGGAISQSVYLEGDAIISPLPYFQANYGRWSLGPEHGIAQYRLTDENAGLQLHIGLGLRDQTYESIFTRTEDRSKHPVFDGYESGSADITATASLSWHTITLKLEQDISSHSQGMGVALTYDYPVPIPHSLGHLNAGIGAQWYSDKYIDYVYGVRRENADLDIGRIPYVGDSGTNFHASLQHIYPLTDEWVVVSQLRSEALDSNIKNSPLVDANNIVSASVLFVYTWSE